MFNRSGAWIIALHGEPFTWGSSLDIETDELRARYLRALRRADDNDISGLLACART